MNTLLSFLGLAQDDQGVFDPYEEPQRMFAEYEHQLDAQAIALNVMRQALRQAFPDDGTAKELPVSCEVAGHAMTGRVFWTEINGQRVIDLEILTTTPPAADGPHGPGCMCEPEAPAPAALSYAERVEILFTDIQAAAYYRDILAKSVTDHGMTMAGIAAHQYSNEALAAMLNTFWARLPDGPEIRRHPFFDLCDLCEEAL